MDGCICCAWAPQSCPTFGSGIGVVRVRESSPLDMSTSAERRLEIVLLQGVLASPAPGRVKVAFKICSEGDADGVEFGSKVSPWTSAEEDGQFRFGRAGIRAQFALGRGGPQARVANPRFLESAELVIEVWVSTAPTVMDTAPAFWQGAAKMLQKVQNPLDQMSRFLTASLRLPLANVLCGRGLAADRALGGWIQLGMEGPRLWMQAYVLPDHAASLPQLEEQLNAAASESGGSPTPKSSPDGGYSPGNATPQGTAGGAGTMQPNVGVRGSSGAFAARPGPWGPANPVGSASALRTTTPATCQDLLDLGSDPATSVVQSQTQLEDIDLLAGGSNVVSASGHGAADLLDDGALVDIPLNDDGPGITYGAPQGQSAFSFVGGAVLQPGQPAQTVALDSSAFNFIGASVQGQSAFPCAGVPATQIQGQQTQAATSESSAFNFISAPATKTMPNVLNDAELGALYTSSSPGLGAGAPCLDGGAKRDFSALYPGWSGLEPSPLTSKGTGRANGGFSLEALEKDALSNLMR